MRHEDMVEILELELGSEEARKAADCICSMWGGEYVRVGLPPSKKERNQAMREQWNQGRTPAELARMFRLSRSQVYRVLFG